MKELVKLMKKTVLVRLIIFLLAGGFVIGSFISDQKHPPERAIVTNLKVGYYSYENGWAFSTPVPTSEREIQVCGLMQKSKQAELLFSISNLHDKNDFLKLDKFYFDIEPGDFCIRLHLLGSPPPGEYTLWVMDARHSVGQTNISFQEE